MLGSSLIVAWYFVMWMGKRKEGLDPELMANTFLVTAAAALVGSRVLYIFTNLGEFETLGDWFDVRSGGLVAYGGFLGGFLGSWGFLRWKKVPLLPWADIVAPVLASGLMLTRVGCYLYGCDYGKPLGDDAPAWLARLGTFPKWTFPADPGFACDQNVSGAPAFTHHMAEYRSLMPPGAEHSLPVHPTQLYESLAGLVLFGVTFYMLEKRRFRGQAILTVTGLYAIWRFIVEYWRDDPERGFALGFSTSQLISLALLPVVLFGWIVFSRRAREGKEAPIPPEALAVNAEAVRAAAANEAAPAASSSSSSSSVVKKKKKKK
jgi:phosphatidylglycerol:prolipoprotein diacylglycerol transferase